MDKRTQQFAEMMEECQAGRINAVTQAELSDRGWGNGVEIRAMVNELRTLGVPICSDRRGYYFAKTSADVSRTITSLKGRIAAMNSALSGLGAQTYVR